MTLNLTVLTAATIYQSADFRLTDGRTGEPHPEPSDKIVGLQYATWSGFLTYTGIGLDLDGRPISSLVADWLTGVEDVAMGNVAELIRTRADSWMEAFLRFRGPYRHTFVLACFIDARPHAYVVSNFQRAEGAIFPISSFIVSSVSDHRFTKVIVTGRSDCVPRAARRRLERAIDQRRGDPAYVRRMLEDENRRVAETEQSQGTVSPECSVYSCDSAGQVRSIRTEGVPGATPFLLEGINLNEQTLELARGILGTHQVAVTLVTAGRSNNRPPVAELPCSMTVIESNESGYRLDDLGSLEGRSTFARAVNNEGLVVGEASLPPNSPPMPCIRQGERWTALPVPEGGYGYARDINDRGDIVGSCVTASTGFLQHAWLWDSSKDSLDLDGRPGYESDALAVNNQARISGRWRIGEGQKQEFDSFPVVWLTPTRAHEILHLEAERWGSAIDLTDANVALVAIQVGRLSSSVALLSPFGELEELPCGNESVTPHCIDHTGRFVLGSILRSGEVPKLILHDHQSGWQQIECPTNSSGHGVNARGDVAGSVVLEGFHRPWFKPFGEEVRMLPYVQFHDTLPTDMTEEGVIVGTSAADHGCHAVIWKPL